MKPYKILVVDDEPVNLKIILAILKPEGYELLTASNGQEALSLVKQKKPDMILLDVMMPEMDGFEVCKQLKTNKETRAIPVIMVTALQEKEHKIQAMESGADDFISKPIERIELIIRVKSLLRIKAYSDELIESYNKLEEKNRELEKLEQIKEGLIHMIIHDMRSPLTSISMNLDLCLMKASKYEELSNYLKNALNFCTYLGDMIQSLLDIYTMEQGALKLHYTNVNPQTLVMEAIQQIKPQLDVKNIKLQINISSSLSHITLDYNLIKRVLINLLDNAIRHTPSEGEIKITVEKNDNPNEAIFSITDSGPGLDPKYHEKIFDKFHQVQFKKNGIIKGNAGLGLAFCKMAVELHGGTIWVTSKQNKNEGCTFSFSLPINGKIQTETQQIN